MFTFKIVVAALFAVTCNALALGGNGALIDPGHDKLA